VCSAKGRIFDNMLNVRDIYLYIYIFIRDKPIVSSERMLHKDYYHKSSVGKESLVMGLKGPDAKTN
jgi:hypothetical protein